MGTSTLILNLTYPKMQLSKHFIVFAFICCISTMTALNIRDSDSNIIEDKKVASDFISNKMLSKAKFEIFPENYTKEQREEEREIRRENHPEVRECKMEGGKGGILGIFRDREEKIEAC